MQLLLSEVTALNDAALLLAIPVVLVLYLPIFYFSRHNASDASKVSALCLALLLLFIDHWVTVSFAPIRILVFYLPLAVVVYKLIRSSAPVKKEPPLE